MALTIGTQLGSHEITGLLGKGGMGEVYRARDTKLKREVAIKILPDEFSRDPERVARFQLEAEVLASLNHPNIAAIYDLEEANGSRFLVLELVEGDTLADILKKRGALPVDEALGIAAQICEGLEAAAGKGIIHRDLKPANIEVTPEGKVKLLDFGLARIFEAAPHADASDSPTLVSRSTPGVILGTAAYMSPEQARGRTVDKRTDVWAFGCVLFEALAGRPVFQGDDVTEIIASIVKAEPDWDLLPDTVSPPLRSLLHRCFKKDPKRRLQEIADARIEIEEILKEPAVAAGTNVIATTGRRKRDWTAWVLVVVICSVLSAVSVFYFTRTEPPPEIRLQINTPSTADPVLAVSFAISPDGRRLVFAASNEGKNQLLLRPLDSLVAQPLAGTEGGAHPFWSPDGGSLGLFADRKLKRVDLNGSATQVLANAPFPGGGAWNSEGVIVFAPQTGPLYKVLASGGDPVPLTRLETGETLHRAPHFLPDGKHFLYFALGQTSGLYVGSLDGSQPKRIGNTDTSGFVMPSGVLLFQRQSTLLAQRFDLRRQELSGDPVSVASGVTSDSIGVGGFSAMPGIVAYRTQVALGTRLTWFDRSGKVLSTIGGPQAMSDVELSPDGRRVAQSRTVNGNADVWLVETARGVPTRFTVDAALDAFPVWVPDGSRIVFSSNRKGVFNLYQKLASGAGPDELLLESDRTSVPNDISRDGRYVLFTVQDLQNNDEDLWILPMFGDKKPFPFIKSPFDKRFGQFSPDGRWVAYESNESGRDEIYAQPFPGPGGKSQISTNGGAQPRWNKNGKEIFYISLDSKMVAAPVKVSSDGRSLEAGSPVSLFPIRLAGGPVRRGQRQQYTVSPDGQRFLIIVDADENVTSPITIIYNWKPRKL
jgi:serine/threonine protein kinase/Tol biopolymer transport system component